MTANAETDKRYGTEFGSAERRALNDERATELRAQIALDGDFPVPGWTLGEGVPDMMANEALAWLDAVQRETDEICARMDALIAERSGQ
ncbi:hypothetical protein OEW28_16480 [Defluviimonas sp. WL0002]|uniref:Uncharacterized protein n=1 Tax=Albidovulum marisflavi TaxID=2984159 RepID=A0ABT2ZGG3_9RHOB|nr:hypothetical protein [Defluviimonas sp. WL0002]MCV2870224.1 hypothetical protein [Defluviimonas sp. WL0002]